MGSMAASIGGSLVTGMMANKAAKKQAGANKYATDMQMQGYTDARPYVQDMYAGGTEGLNNALDAGYYGGPTYAGMNDMQNTGANNMYNFGNNAFGNAGNTMNATGGFGQNYADLYNKASADRAGVAEDYVNSNADPMVNRALRDSTRQLEEGTLRNIGMGASATGNANSPRAGVAEAIAGRSYMDRAADTRAGIESNLRNESFKNQDAQFANMMNANAGMSTANNNAFGMGNTASGNMMNAGSAFQTNEQNQYNDAKANFEGDRDFQMDQYNKYNAGILGRAPQTSGNVRPNLVDPTMAGLGGAMAGMGIGKRILNGFQPQASPTMQGQGYNMGPSTGFGFGGSGNRSPYLYGDGFGGGD